MNPSPSAILPWQVDVFANRETDSTETMIDSHDSTVFLNFSSTESSLIIISLNYNLPTMIVVATILFLVIIATAIGNMLVGLALLRYQHLRTISNYLIGNLALSDFLLATTIFPLSTVNECLGHWIFGRAMCNIWLLTDVLCCTASLWNICVIAFDRFTATLYPIWYREKRSNRQAAVYVATVWFIASSICVPPLLGWNDLSQNYVYDNITDVYRCVLFQTPSYVLYSASGSFFVPFFLTVFLYVQIFIVLRKRMAKMRRTKGTSRSGAATTKDGSRRPIANQTPLQPNTNSKLEKTKRTELEMTSVATLSSREAERVAEEGSLKSFLSSDSCDDLDQQRPLQGGKGNAVVKVVLHHKDTALHAAKVSSGSEVRSKCSVKFLTGWKLANWARPSRNGSLSRSTSSAIKQTDREEPRKTVRPSDETDNITTNLVVDEEDETDENHHHHQSTPENLPPGGGQPYRRRQFLLRRLFKHRSWRFSSEASSRQGSTSSRVTGTPTQRNSNSSNHKQNHHQQQHRRFDQREIQATIRMAIIIAFFCGMWVGFFAVYVVQPWCPRCSVSRELGAFFFWLGYSNSSINPILYTIFNEDFRKAFQKILGCYRKREPNSGSSSTPRH